MEARLCCLCFSGLLRFCIFNLDTIARVYPLNNVPPMLCAISRQGNNVANGRQGLQPRNGGVSVRSSVGMTHACMLTLNILLE